MVREKINFKNKYHLGIWRSLILNICWSTLSCFQLWMSSRWRWRRWWTRCWRRWWWGRSTGYRGLFTDDWQLTNRRLTWQRWTHTCTGGGETRSRAIYSCNTILLYFILNIVVEAIYSWSITTQSCLFSFTKKRKRSVSCTEALWSRPDTNISVTLSAC